MAKKKLKINKPASTEVLSRGCKECGRWQLFAKKIFQDSGELCDIDTCINMQPWDMPFLDFYDESEALKEKSDD